MAEGVLVAEAAVAAAMVVAGWASWVAVAMAAGVMRPKATTVEVVTAVVAEVMKRKRATTVAVTAALLSPPPL